MGLALDRPMTLAATALAALAALCTVAVLLFAVASRGRWGTEPAPAVDVGGGPFRGGAVSARRPRGLPGVVGAAAGTGFFWAALTALVFAPAGGLLALLFADQAPAFLAALVVLVALSGLLLAISLVAASVQLLRRGSHAASLGRGTAIWSYAHHGAVFAVMAIAALVEPHIPVLLLAAIPCAVGAVHALLLQRAAAEVERAPHD